MAILTWDLPADSDAWPCPEACGGLTEDPAGGPCKRCWDKVPGPQSALTCDTTKNRDLLSLGDCSALEISDGRMSA